MTTPHALPLPQLLGNAADALRRAERDCLDLQVALGGILARIGEIRATELAELQRIDLVTQSLGDLASFLAALGRQVPEGRLVEAGPLLTGLLLRDLAARLAGLKAPEDGDGDFLLHAPPAARLDSG